MILCFLFVEATSHEEIEIKVDNLRKMSVVSGQLRYSWVVQWQNSWTENLVKKILYIPGW